MITHQQKAVMDAMVNVAPSDAKAMLAERAALEKLVIESRGNYTLYGPPGTGKSTIGRRKAAHWNLESYPIQCSDQMSGASIYQIAWVEADGSMSVRRAPGLTAFERGGILVVEEINEASQDALGVLTMLLVDGHGATVRTLDNELITKHAECMAVATMNGDPSELPERILNRAPAVPIMCPSPEMLRSLPDDLARLTARAYAAVYVSGLQDGLPFTFRQMQVLADLRQTQPLNLAALVAFNGNRELAKAFADILLPLCAAPSGSRQTPQEQSA